MENNNNGVQTPNEGAGTQQQPVDYEKEFKALTEKYNSLNNDYIKKSDAYDKVSSENADYKRKERDKLSDEQKKEQALQELIDSKNQMEAELKAMKLEKDLLANGFSADESTKLINGNFAVKDIADILKARLDAQEKSLRAELIKGTTPATPLGGGTLNGANPETGFQKYQKSKEKPENIINFKKN